jgi:hypothetical protein
MDDDGHSKCRRHRIHGNVVVGRSDPAGRKEIIVLRSKRVHRLDDPRRIIRHHPHLFQPDALIVQPQRHLRDILVLGPTGEDLIADHQQRGGPSSLFY